MLGLPTETRKESLQTIEFAKKLNPDWAQFTITIPYPGTPLFEKLKGKSEIKSFNWDEYKTWGGWTEGNIPYVTRGRTIEELKNIQQEAVRRFYLRPKIFLRFLRRIDSWKTFKKYIAGLFVLMKINKSSYTA